MTPALRLAALGLMVLFSGCFGAGPHTSDPLPAPDCIDHPFWSFDAAPSFDLAWRQSGQGIWDDPSPPRRELLAVTASWGQRQANALTEPGAWSFTAAESTDFHGRFLTERTVTFHDRGRWVGLGSWLPEPEPLGISEVLMPEAARAWLDAHANGPPECILRTMSMLEWGGERIWSASVVNRRDGSANVSYWNAEAGTEIPASRFPGMTLTEARAVLANRLDGYSLFSASAIEGVSPAAALGPGSPASFFPALPDSIEGDGRSQSWTFSVGSHGIPTKLFVVLADGRIYEYRQGMVIEFPPGYTGENLSPVGATAIDSVDAIEAARSFGPLSGRTTYRLDGGHNLLQGEDTWTFESPSGRRTIVADGKACLNCEAVHERKFAIGEVSSIEVDADRVPVGSRVRLRGEIEGDSTQRLPVKVRLVVDGQIRQNIETYLSQGRGSFVFEPRLDEEGNHSLQVNDAEPVTIEAYRPARFVVSALQSDPVAPRNGSHGSFNWTVKNVGGEAGYANVVPIVIADAPHPLDRTIISMITHHHATSTALLEPQASFQGTGWFSVHSLRPIEVQIWVDAYEEGRLVIEPSS